MQVAKYAEIEWTRTVGSRGGGSKRYDELPADKRPGNRFKRLFKGVPGEPGNFEVSVTKTIRSEEVKHYPRHHHIFEQLRMTLVGTPEWTPRSPTPPGWVIYVGAGTSRMTGRRAMSSCTSSSKAPTARRSPGTRR
jgi:hypothetical protein